MGSLTVNGIARITRDAEVSKSGDNAWLRFGIAVHRRNPKEGKQAVDFFDCDLYMKAYTNGMEGAFTKGKLMYIETAYLRNDEYPGPDGGKRNKIKLSISSYEFLDTKPEPKPAKKEEEPLPDITDNDFPPY